MSGRARLLDAEDAARAAAFCERDPIANLAMLARLRQFPPGNRAGIEVWGFERSGELVALCMIGGSVLLAGDDADALAAFVDSCGRYRRAGSMCGPASGVLPLFDMLGRRWGGGWLRPRNVRAAQPLMVWTKPCEITPEPTVRRLTEDEFDSYFDASVRMYTEEIGVSPLASGAGYDNAVRYRLRDGLAFGVVRDGRVLFKADLGLVYGQRAQVQGVWLDPVLRGRGLAAPAMAAVLELIRWSYPSVSLYVNDFNVPAIRTYERCGFVRVGTMATVHY